MTPLTMLKVAVVVLALLLGLRFLLHTYLDRGKFADFTIVSLMRDMGPEALAADKTAYAFQYTALMSWARLVVGRNIIVFVDSVDACPPIQALVRGLQCYPAPLQSEYRKPLLNYVFDEVHQYAYTDIVVFASSDVVLYPDLGAAIKTVSSNADKFMMVGKRTNTLVSSAMLEDFRSESFSERLRAHAEASGVLHSAYGIDLFVYRKSLLTELRLSTSVVQGDASKVMTPPASLPETQSGVRFPAFLAGASRWDNWLLAQAILDDTVTVVDITPAVMYVHQEKGAVASSVDAVTKPADKVGEAYNKQLVKALTGTHYKVGSIDNAALVLRADGTLEPNPAVTDVVMFTRRASPGGYLVILTVNNNYINLALNWVCWADRIKFNNFILLAEDQSSAEYFRKRGVAVIVSKTAPFIKKAGDYGSIEFQETMSFRTEFLMNVLTAGFHFVTADMDGLWLDDPIRYFNDAADLQGQMHKVTKISGGLVIVRATTYGKYFWNMVIECQRGNAEFLAHVGNKSYVAATYTEQYCINELSRGLASQPLFSRSLLDPFLFPDGKSFFEEANSQYRGIWPAIIHNNWIVGTKNKINRLIDWNLSSANTDLGECVDLDTVPFPRLPFVQRPVAPEVKYDAEHPRQLGLPTPEAYNPPAIAYDMRANFPFELKIRIFTSTNAVALRRCLESLARTEFEGDAVRIGLEISVDALPLSAEADERRGRSEVLQVAHKFAWNAQSKKAAGEKLILEQPYAIGASGQFLRGWIPNSHTDHELMLYLDDSVVLAPGWYQWLKRALLKYAAHPAQFDPRLMGISLNVQNLVLGETHLLRYGGEDASNQRNPYDLLLPTKTMYYKYQLFSPANTATLLFPQHWRLFRAWLEKHKVDTLTGFGSGGAAGAAAAGGLDTSASAAAGTTPCVPTMISNAWWREAPTKHWYQWLNRFTFEQGYYFLYTNFPQRKALAINGALLSPAHQLKMIRMNPPSLVANITLIPNELPSSPLIPVYDFHFNHVSTPDVLAWRQHITAPRVIPQCFTMDFLPQRIADLASAEAAKEAAKQAEKAAKKKLADEAKAAKKAEEEAKKKAAKEAADKKKADEKKAKEAKDKKDKKDSSPKGKGKSDEKSKQGDSAAKKKKDATKSKDTKDSKSKSDAKKLDAADAVAKKKGKEKKDKKKKDEEDEE